MTERALDPEHGDSTAHDHAETLLPIFLVSDARYTDRRGRCWEMVGAAIAVAQWHTAYPSFLSFKSLACWMIGERVGFSDVTEVVGITRLSKRRPRLASLQPG